MTLGVGTITSDAVVERLFVTKLDRLILCFFVGPRHTNEALLVHPLTGTFNSFELPPEKYFREANDKYQAARQRAPADPHTTQPALDELLTDATTMLRLVLDFIENSIPTCGLTIVPRMQLTAVPFHALPVADKRLIDIVADITYAPSLGIITEQTAMGPWPDQDAGVTMLESTATPAFIGAARQIAAARSLRSTLDPPARQGNLGYRRHGGGRHPDRLPWHLLCRTPIRKHAQSPPRRAAHRRRTRRQSGATEVALSPPGRVRERRGSFDSGRRIPWLRRHTAQRRRAQRDRKQLAGQSVPHGDSFGTLPICADCRTSTRVDTEGCAARSSSDDQT